MKSWPERLAEAVNKKGTPALVGLDPRYQQLPEPVVLAAGMRRATDPFNGRAAAYEEFCFRIIDVVAPLVPAVKPQMAFFEEQGPAGMQVLRRVIQRARQAGLLVVLDGKRGDIGSTAEAYAKAYLAGEDPDAAPYAADALTINPSMGADTIEPFLSRAEETGAGLYALVRTSNPGSGFTQNWSQDGKLLYQHLGETFETRNQNLSGQHNGYGLLGAVVGATYPEELGELRALMPGCPLLVPGYGSQGGTSADVAAGFDENGHGALVNSSRGINFAHLREPYASRYSPEEWEQAVHDATVDMIDDLATHTPAGRLRDA